MIGRRICLALLSVLLLASAFAGLADAFTSARSATGAGQWTVIVGQIAYGIGGVLAVAAIGARHPSAEPLLYVWGAGTLVAASVAPVAYGGQGIGVGAISGAGTLAVTALIIWAYRRFGRINPMETTGSD